MIQNDGADVRLTGLVVLLDEVLIGKFSAIDGLSASSIASGEITTLRQFINAFDEGLKCDTR